MKNIAIILASGSGSRFGTTQPKQFVKLAGKPVIQYTIEAFEHADSIDEIIVVTKQEYIDYVYEIINAQLFKKISKVIVGGRERYDSTLSALSSIKTAEANLIIHDAVRPFISERIINDCVKALEKYSAVDVVVDAVDTIVKIDGPIIQDIPDRRFLKRGQTPQAFKKTILKKAYNLFMQDKNRIATDDCGIVLKYIPDIPIGIVLGEEANFKLTHQQDMYLADNLIKDGLMGRVQDKKIKIQKVLEGKILVVIGASSGIGKDIATICESYNAIVFSCSRELNNVDVTNIESLKNMLKKVHQTHTKIDYIINTSGLLIRKPIMTMTEHEITNCIQTNYIGVLNVARTSFEYLKQSRGMLINFASSSYTRGRANYSIYSSTKAAVVNLTQALAEEWLSHGIKINVINPERTKTPMRISNFGIEPDDTLLTSKEVADFTIKALCSNHTGQIYTIKKDI